jgi:hypothetical protein
VVCKNEVLGGSSANRKSPAVTQDYLADVRKPGEAKKALADADFIPTP